MVTWSRTLIFVLVVLAFAAPALADGTPIPEEWLGIWEQTVNIYDCDTNDLLFTTTQLDTLCPGAVFEDPDGGGTTLNCTTTADGSSYTTHCEGSSEVFPGCTSSFVYDVTGTLSGDSYSATSVTNISFTGDCQDLPDQCQRTELSGTRLGPAPEPCGSSPVEHQSWGSIKSLYR